MKFKHVYWIFLLTLIGCVGTDHLDDPKDAAILTDIKEGTLMIGTTLQIEASYFYNMYRQEQVNLAWVSSNVDVATVDQMGLVAGLTKGQVTITITAPDETSVSVAIVVVENVLDVARVAVTAPATSVALGETLQMSATAFTINEEVVTDPLISWSTNNNQIATIDQNGLLTAVADGSVQVTAVAEGVKSLPFVVMVGNDSRVGTFQGSGNYQATGTAVLTYDEFGNLILSFSDDFTTSFALGTFVYLANNTSGTTVRAQGLEISEINTNGAKTFNISQINGNITLDTYAYVILLCKPASITFGVAELN